MARAQPRVLCDVDATARTASSRQMGGAAWRLEEGERQLDANLVHLPAGETVAPHTEPDLDVLLLVVAGEGELRTDDGGQRLTAGTLAWLPRGSRRGLTAGATGLSYLTTHRRRPGLRIRPAGESVPPRRPEPLRKRRGT